jgi:acetyl-CoA carboxylase carboxyltransferase component
LAGSHLVKAAIGEIIDNEKLGGADTHSEISGIVDYKVKDDISCLDKIKSIISKVNLKKDNNFRRIKPILPKKNPLEIYKIIPKSNSQPYNMKEIIYRLIDNSEFEEFKEGYGKTIICGTARIDGWPVGIVANERLVVKNKKGEIQLGGVIYSDSADKSARFIMNCNQKNIPLVFLQDVTGFMVGSRSEHGGIIKDGAKMVNAVANSVVPKFTIIIGNSYGAGNYAMCGKAYDPRLILAWPSAKIGVMGANQATNVISSINKKNKKKSYNEKKIFRDYENQTDPFYAASRLWIDEIIDPIKTREYISVGIEISNNSISNDKFNVGLIQV